VECGFDQTSSEISNHRTIFFLTLLVIFEVEVVLAIYMALGLNFLVVILLVLFAFGIIEIALTGKR